MQVKRNLMNKPEGQIKSGGTWVKSFYVFWFFISACVLTPGAAAQENLEGRIFYVHGTEFTLILGGQEGIYGPGVLNSSEISLGNEDIIQTGPKSFLEFQFLPDGTGIKVAENTFVQVTWREDRLPVITISYGRIRVVTGLEAPSPALYVQAGDGIVSVQKGDFCFDYLFTPEDSPNESGEFLKPKLQMHDFRGSSEAAIAGDVRIRLSPSSSRGDWPAIPVKERESVSLEIDASLVLIERKSLDMGIVEYWKQNNFQGTPPKPLPDTTLAFGTDVQITQEDPRTPGGATPKPQYDFTASQRRLTLIKNTLIISGLTLTITGIAAQAVGYAIITDPVIARRQANFGFIPVGIGISAIIAALFFNPAFP
jgi:hypothetical protein